MEDIKGLKSVLRSLVVSSPTQMTLTALLRDYRNMMGAALPITKFGYRDPLLFLKERCGDCFLFQGGGGNPVLVPIVPEQLKHIDSFVQKQKMPSHLKFIGKRRSVAEEKIKPAPDLIAKTFTVSNKPKTNLPNVVDEEHTRLTNGVERSKSDTRQQLSSRVDLTKKHEPAPDVTKHNKDNNGHCENNMPSMEAYKNFLRKRLPIYDSNQDLDNDHSYRDSDSGKCTSDSDPHTVSTSSSSRAERLAQLKAEVTQLVLDSADGVLCTDLMKLYRERYGRELDFSRFGLTSVSALAASLAGVRATSRGGALLLQDQRAAPPPPRRPRRRDAAPTAPTAPAADHAADDALPWIDFDPDVFPADCVSFSESIPEAALGGLGAGDMLELMLGEVYSPSHFWFYRLGEHHHVAMENMMDEMTEYYERGEGKDRSLAVGAVRVGHYCSSVFERDWHRSLIVQRLDTDTVKVRHVDYGTVDRARVAGLKPLLRRWARLPAQAVRARLAGLRPAAGGRRWPHAAAAAFLRLVRDRRLVGNVVHVDNEENIVELFLIDTATERDVRIDLELIRGGHADPRGSAVGAAADTYLFPRFSALESGATPNFADISAYLRDGIALEFVDEYRRHVPCELPGPAPPPRPPPPPPLPSPPPRLDNRVPLPFPPSLTSDADSDSEADRQELEAVPSVVAPAPAPASPAPSPPPPAREPDAVPRTVSATVAPSARPAPAQPPARPPARAAVRVPPEPRPPPRAPPPPPPSFPPLAPPYPAPVPFFLFPPSPHMPPMPMPPMPHMSHNMPPMPMSAMPPYMSCSNLALSMPFPAQPPPAGCEPPAPPAPPPAQSPPPPYSGGPRRFATGQGEVTLSVSECEIFSLLSSVDPNAAHWYMVDALRRAMAACAPRPAPREGGGRSRLNPEAREFRLASAETQTEAVSPAVRRFLQAARAASGVTPPPGFD